MAEITYVLCAATSLMAAILLLRRYWQHATRLLFWSAVGFSGLAVNNLLVLVDLLLVPDVDLSPARALVAALSMLALMGGLISETA